MTTHRCFGIAAAAFLFLSTPGLAADPESCKTIRLSDPGWTDINSTNAIASVILEGLGYQPEVQTLSVLVGYQSLKNQDIDVFLGNWMPAQQKFIDELNEAEAAEVLVKNLTGAKFTLAVPDSVAEMGVRDFKDLDTHADAFDKKIYGIEPGAPANENIQRMIEADHFGLGDWSLVESSESGMLSQVARSERAKEAIVFLAWAPHPMNNNFKITYLSGGDEFFGPNYGGAEVFTLARTGWSAECPNAAQLFRNLVFTIDMENEMMGKILEEGKDPEDAAAEFLKAHPQVLEPWLAEVTTLDGEPGLAAVRASLGL
ncbi:choline ABC transporter substrate-binding protein [Nitratireductor sp. ZSWI3]|uniref:choline ABC transporter substrate-binding protein n=1 Tax=Nitratireductor sp. ZSWI3 TaxID=2966359 RepID=UPI00214F6E43|nr:choline ABC transporter substrate-binding protein [Nitratireductor sp. ZSWI3]MCR4264719.1 choline ABC transporter substrate-binding protein [Nitratireductor sp. ZSWI3]